MWKLHLQCRLLNSRYSQIANLTKTISELETKLAVLETEYESVVGKKKKVESDLTAANDSIKHKDADIADLKKVREWFNRDFIMWTGTSVDRDCQLTP